jgi:hypothetical protein
VTTPCPHPTPRRRGQTVLCEACGARANVPKCVGCLTKKDADGKHYPSPTTWMLREETLVCYKCATAVLGLRITQTPEERMSA